MALSDGPAGPAFRAGQALIIALVLGAAGLVRGTSGDPLPRSVPGRFEVDGFDFRPLGAWRKRADAVRRSRAALLGQKQLTALNRSIRGGMATRVEGTFFVPVVPVAFRNVAAPFAAQDYQRVLFAPDPAPLPYSVRTYYAEVSRGRIAIDGVVLGWAIADSNDTYYEDGCNGVGVLTNCPHGGQRFAELLIEALQQADNGVVDWGQFDNDGDDGVPNSGDDDGAVDFVTFLQPEVDGACGTENLWAHRYDVAGWLGGSGYVTRSPVRDGAGQPVPGRFIQIRDYTLQSAVGGPGACSDGEIMPIGTVSHETGHAFGLPDLYDTNLRSPSVTQGIGEWSLMGSGNYTQPYSPAGLDAWSLAELGWAAVDTFASAGTASLSPVATSDTVLYLDVPGTDEFLLFENRQAIGSDTAHLNPACRFRTRNCAKAPGLLIWHIDRGQVAAHGYRQDNRVNVGPVHGVALVQADGLNDLRTPGSRNRGDPGDPWPGSSGNTRFAATTNPAALDNQGTTIGFELDSIRQETPGGAIGFRLTRTLPGQVVLTLTHATDGLLGRTPLLMAQSAWLDSVGNQNGRYDTGDFLAFYDMQLFLGTAARARANDSRR
jgi:M6 family metalloprotease-like protein